MELFDNRGQSAIVAAAETKAAYDADWSDYIGPARKSLAAALRLGERLCRDRKGVKTDWERWVKQHCPFAPRTASRFMRLWANRAMTLGAETETEAMQMIAEKLGDQGAAGTKKPKPQCDRCKRVGQVKNCEACKEVRTKARTADADQEDGERLGWTPRSAVSDEVAKQIAQARVVCRQAREAADVLNRRVAALAGTPVADELLRRAGEKGIKLIRVQTEKGEALSCPLVAELKKIVDDLTPKPVG